MELTLLRHAPPPTAYHGRYIGHTDIMIDETLFEHSKIEHLLHQKFDRIYSSDLVRCTATLKMMGMEPFITDSRLREVRFKPFIEGKSFTEIEIINDFNSDVLASKESWHNFICDEPILSFRTRVESFLNDVSDHERILICAHGGTIAMISSLIDPTLQDRHLGYLDTITVCLG